MTERSHVREVLDRDGGKEYEARGGDDLSEEKGRGEEREVSRVVENGVEAKKRTSSHPEHPSKISVSNSSSHHRR